MPMPTRWTRQARQSILDMMQQGKSREEIEVEVGESWPYIWSRLEYHGRMEALQRRRELDPGYAHLALTHPDANLPAPPRRDCQGTDEIDSEDERRAIEALYAPRVPVPERYRKYAGKAYG